MIKEGEWYTASFEGGTIGNTFAVIRAKRVKPETVRGRLNVKLWEFETLCIDLQSVFTLTGTRTAQRKELVAELRTKNVQKKSA